jgi:phosphatidate cytidylyltransferase
MLRTRLWVGACLIALVAGVLALDRRLAPWFPFLFVLVLGLTLVACHELLALLPSAGKPAAWLCYAGLIALTAANWVPHIMNHFLGPARDRWNLQAWGCVASVLALLVLAAFLVEMATFEAPGESVKRIGLTVGIAAYLGLLGSFLAQLRWLPDLSGGPTSGKRATVALAAAIFVPKCCDIGAYFTGRFLGRHPMAPVLSPKKTWEGAAGGLAAAIVAAIAIEKLSGVSLLEGGIVIVAIFGLTLGIAGILGDLAESLIKRDCQRKDASQVVPGFGGVLDVVDSIVFAAPVTYWWLA